MNLGIFLASGDSFKNMAKSGQDVLFKKFYLRYFSKNFSQVYIFSYANEKVDGLPKNVQVIPNKYNLHRYLYGLLMPFLNLTLVNKCDVIRVYHLFGTIPAIITKIFFNKNYIFNFAYDYEKVAQIENKKIRGITLKLLKPIAIFFSNKIFAANKIILAQIPKSKSVYLPNGVDTTFFRQLSKRKTNPRPLILSVGRLEKQKNFESLILAMADIKSDLLIVGNGSLKSKLVNLAQKNRVNLKIIEKVDNNRMPQIYNRADIFVLPSLAEGSPKVLLEAMACGLSVIGAKVVGIKETITNGITGLLCDTDSQSLSKSIVWFLKNPKRADKLAQSARKRILQDYNLHHLLKKEVLTLKGLVAK